MTRTSLTSALTATLLNASLCLTVPACGDSTDAPNENTQTENENQGEQPEDDGPLYAFVSQVSTPDETITFVALSEEVPNDELDLAEALEVPGSGNAYQYEGKVYITNGERFEVTRYAVKGGKLVAEDKVSFADRGLTWMGKLYFVDDTHAYMVNGSQYNIIEWNPKAMTIVDEHDVSDLKIEGWGSEYRGGFMRESDGKLFVYWAYNNNREEFLNDLVVGVFDSKEKSFKVLTKTDCPSSAGFGGFFDESGDLYLIADSFGGFTFLGSEEPKDACIVRIKDGEDEFDEDYNFHPTEALGNGLAPWGFYYAGDGIAYTTAVDPAALEDYDSLFEFIFAPVHDGYALNVFEQTAKKIEGMPPDAVGFESINVDGEILIPRSQADAEIYDVNDIQTKIYGLNDEGDEADLLFTMPGYIGNALRLR